MKLTSMTIALGVFAKRLSRERARIDAFERADARVRRKARIELSVADVDGDDLRRAAREQDIGEASGRGADVEADEARGSSAKASSAAASLTPPRDAQGWGASASIGASPATSSEAFLSATPPTLTSPAAIAACARARLEKKPRSTRTISARLRMALLTGRAKRIVNANPGTNAGSDVGLRRNEDRTSAFR